MSAPHRRRTRWSRLRRSQSEATIEQQQAEIQEQQAEIQRLKDAHASLQEEREAQALRHAAQVQQHKAELDKCRKQQESQASEVRVLQESRAELQRMLLNQEERAADESCSAREAELEIANRGLKDHLERVATHVEMLQQEHMVRTSSACAQFSGFPALQLTFLVAWVRPEPGEGPR